MPSQNQIVSHWYKSLENFNTSPLEFYASIERAIQSRQIPETKNSRVDWREGGLLSAKREYLRIKRRRLIFDICGAPYGTGFFVSWWLVESTPSPVGAILVSLFAFFFGLIFCIGAFGFFFGLLLFTIAMLVGLALVAAAISQGAEWADPVLEIPVVGLIIRSVFQPVTYYRIDTTIMFQQAIHASVLEAVDEMTQAKGLRPLSESERQPIMKQFFQR